MQHCGEMGQPVFILEEVTHLNPSLQQGEMVTDLRSHTCVFFLEGAVGHSNSL